ncbi:MAG: hypothetical protein JWN27_1755 [Candidatus Eremiobacteraeota bacterium]|nr:hypothetical protein [Candidatus Eremiobacteraeota bacterium]
MAALSDQRIAKQRILFGSRAEAFAKLALAGPLLVLGSKRSLAELDGIALGDGEAHRFAGVTVHNPQRVVDAARAEAARILPASIVAIGSSSAIDLGKAVAFGRTATLVSVPTALGGAEMTRGFGVLQPDGEKAGNALGAPSDVVIYDPALLASLGARELGSIGINAFAHTIEAAYARYAQPLGVAGAVRAGRMLAAALPRAALERSAENDRELFEGAYLAGFALNACGMGFHHAACHVLGGLSGVPHGIVNAVVLPHAVRANVRVAPAAVAAVADAFCIADLAAHADAIARSFGLPATLAELGVDAGIVTQAPPLIAAAHQMKNNPAPVGPDLIELVVRLAYGG